MSKKTERCVKVWTISISWKVDCATQELQIKFVGNVKTHELVVEDKSQDLKNILGKTTLIDCQSDASANEQPSERDDDDGRIVKHEVQWPQYMNSMAEVIQCLCNVTWFKTKLWEMCVQRCFDQPPLKSYPTLVKREEKLITEVLQNCNGRESTSRSFSQSRSHWQMKLVKRSHF